MSNRQGPAKHPKLLGVKVGDGFGSTSLRAPKSKTPSPNQVLSKGDVELNNKLLMTLQRSLENTITISKTGSKISKKDNHEVISCYETKDGTENTKEDNPVVHVDRRQVEQVADFEGNNSESLIERKVTFTVHHLEDTSQAESPISVAKQLSELKAEEPSQNDERLGSADGAASTTAIVEPNRSTGLKEKASISESVTVEILESVLCIRQKEPNREAQKLQEKPGEKKDDLLGSDDEDDSQTGKGVRTNELFEIVTSEAVVLVESKPKTSVNTKPPISPNQEKKDSFKMETSQIVVEKVYD
jgi:hypothetical protein